MFEKIVNIFKEKDDKKKTENLVAFLIILVVTLILVNKILGSDSKDNKEVYQNKTGTELVVNSKNETELVNDGNDLEKRLGNILSKIDGVGEVNILVTYRSDDNSKIEGAIVIAQGARGY